MNLLKILILLVTIYININSCISSRQIPDYLLHCYKNGGVTITAPNNVQLLVELLTKIEKNNTNYNIRSISKSLLHNLRQDGIERAPKIVESDNVIPYRASAYQYYKFDFVFKHLIPSKDVMKIYDSLTPNEICTLHFLISSTVDHRQRGDEHNICPMNMEKGGNGFSDQTNSTRGSKTTGVNSCPIEKGVIQTHWGDVSPGVLIAGIAAGLEPQKVKYNDLLHDALLSKKLDRSNFDNEFNEFNEFNEDSKVIKFTNEIMKKASSEKFVSNVLAATLTGDLAELTIRQGPLVKSDQQNYTFGPPGKWNDSIIPRDYYLLQKPPLRWEMTNAEILGGMDGYIIANYIRNWTEFRSEIRLSQIIEMYYSSYGIAFDDNIRACHRKRNIVKILKIDEINEQTLSLVNLLWLSLSNLYMDPKEIEYITKDAVKAFSEYWPKLVESLPGCDVGSDTSPMNTILVTDQTWDKYKTQQLVSILSETLDVSNQGSSLSLIHGNTGEWIFHPTNSIFEVFSNMTNSTDIWVDRLDLENVLTTVVQYLESENQLENTTIKTADLPRVVIIAAPSSKLTQSELSRSNTIMQTLRKNYVDVYFVYYIPDVQGFEILSNDPYQFSNVHIQGSDLGVLEVAEKIRMNFIEKAMPKRLLPKPCANMSTKSFYEDYISVGQKIIYRIHPTYLIDSDMVKVEFMGTGQGEISVCISRQYSEDAAESCRIINGDTESKFQVVSPCNDKEFCRPIYFIVRARSSYINCGDKDCRYPNQIRYTIKHSGLRCIGERSSSDTLIPLQNVIIILLMSYILLR